ncbi:MAG: protein kinase domain-containing protein [Bryobacteraceae bacterium]
MAFKRTKLQERYELRDVLGKGGMGVVYKALDTLMKREVALKTILDIDNPALVELFYKEWSIVATMVHPNVIGIYDIGEFEEEGIKKPFFVMPLLPGVALDKLIRDGSPRLTTENVVNIIDQACRGLHAAHEQGLVHRDVKPSNIFVMDDDSVKIIDFGIARIASTQSKTGMRGTLFYLAPEFLEMKPPTALSDQFALAVTAYEALTRRRPFDGASDNEVFEAIRRFSPPPVSELNPNVNYAISQVIHKAMAKQPYHRFLTVREFGDALQKARRNEPLELFDSAKIKPRLERARLSFEQGDYNFALEIVAELEAEGRLDPEVGLLRRQVDQAVRHTRIKQSLEGARRFLEAAEYPLALRKIQDALDLDPEDTDALSLKAQVERERREKKIEEWIQIAHQHLEHQAFGQARDALNNVLKMKPSDTVALALMAEVGRRERDASQVREDKARLYQAARQFWDKGDVTAALSKLEHLMKLDHALPDADAGRAGTYHSFYNQVHSEHNSIKNAYEEARRNLAGENYEAALATCHQYLSRYPNHALFQALKFDIEERQRQALSTVIAKTDRRVEEEADLHKRVGILEEVLKLYPGEPHFERALKLVRDKRDLVNSIVSKARYFEERDQFNEALDQWQILRSIYERHPGLAFEIERLMKKRDQQARENSKAMWVQQTDRCLEAGDYEGALRSVESALVEFPGEPDLLELGNVARNGSARAGEALQLLARARELSEQGALGESLDPLRQAAKLEPGNTVIRTVLVNSLLDDARGLMQKPDWEAAEARLKELLSLDPSHAGAKSLASQIADRKHEEFVSLCITQARRLQAEGDLARAIAVVAQGLQVYPKDSRFEQLQATLQRAQSETQRQPATRDFREMPKAGTDLATPAKPPQAPAVTPPPPASAPSATVIMGSARAQPPPLAKVTPAAPRNPVSPAAPPPAPPGKPASGPGTQPMAARNLSTASRNLLYATAGLAAIMLVIVGGAVIARLGHHPPPVAIATYRVLLRSSPEGAAISVNGRPCGSSTCRLQLPPGNYQAEATLSGYQNATAAFAVTADRDAPGEVSLILEATPAQVTLSTDLTEGMLSVDGAPAAQIQGGETGIPNLSPGQHKLEIQGSGAKASLSFEFPSSALPKLTGPIQAQGIDAVVISRYGSQAMVYCSAEGVPVAVDGKLTGAAGAAGLELKELAPGPHEVQVTMNGSPRKILFESSTTSGIIASLLTERNVGSLRIITGYDDVAVYLNGQKIPRSMARGRLLLFLAPKQYTVRVERPGLWAADQTVDVRRGEEANLAFKLVPAKATLEVRGAPAGTEVWLDGAQIGSARDGGFSSTNIEPGKHTVALKKNRFRTSQAEYVFEPGKSISVEGSMQSATGTLKIEVDPHVEGLQLRLLREGETREQVITETELSLPEGTYRVTGSAPQYEEAVATAHVTAGGGTAATLIMRRVGRTPLQSNAQAAFSMEEWAKASGAASSSSNWAREGKLWVKRGGEFVVEPANPLPGTYIFTVILMRGKRLEWVVNYRDDKNYDLFELDGKNLVRTQFVNGKKKESVKRPFSMKTSDYVSVMITVTPNSIVNSFFVQQRWQVVDKWEKPGGGLQGKIGFHVPGKDQIGVSDFQFHGEPD